MTHKNLKLAELNKLAGDLYAKIGPKTRIIGLIGQLGAGKTTFTQAIASKLGVKTAKSPTFTIINRYQNKSKSLYHIDLYRLETEKELAALGLEEILDDEQNIVVIEWIDKFPNLMKKCQTIIELTTPKPELRTVKITYQ